MLTANNGSLILKKRLERMEAGSAGQTWCKPRAAFKIPGTDSVDVAAVPRRAEEVMERSGTWTLSFLGHS